MICSACSTQLRSPGEACQTCGEPERARGTAAGLSIGSQRLVFAADGRLGLEHLAAGGGPDVHPLPVAELAEPPRYNGRPAAEAAVWGAFAGGARVVRIAGPAGAGTTTFIHALAAAAVDHGFRDGARIAADVRGPAGDVEQQIARLFDDDRLARFADARERAALCDERQALVLFDNAQLEASAIRSIVTSFPSLAFVIAGTFDHPAAQTVELGPLTGAAVVALLADSYGRPLDEDNARVAPALCATVGSLPGPTRLVGIAARHFERSFISLHVEFASGDAVIRELIASLPDCERRILGILVLAGVPLAAHHIAYIGRGGQLHTSLERLTACELVRVCGTDVYDVPRYVARLVAPESDSDALGGRIIDALCDTLDSWPVAPVYDRQLAGAQRALGDAAAHAHWRDVFEVGFRLARIFALHGRFGAWGDVLDRVDAVAARAGYSAELSRAQHDRAILATVSTLAGAAAAEPESKPAAAPAPLIEAASGETDAGISVPRAFALLAVGLAIVALYIVLFIAQNRPGVADPRITQLTATPVAGGAGRDVELCVAATDTAVVEVFPNAVRLVGDGRHCFPVHPSAATTYVAIGTAADGRQTRRSIRVDAGTPVPAQLRISAFSARPARISSGQSTHLCYDVTGARLLRIAPQVGDVTRLRSCRTITLRNPQRYRWTLAAADGMGRVVTRHVDVMVVAARRSIGRRSPSAAADDRLTRRAIYQFDATPGRLNRGQVASLCVGVGRPARGFVTHIGALQPGITRCYRIAPRATTVYRLYVALRSATLVRTVTVAVGGSSRREVASNGHR